MTSRMVEHFNEVSHCPICREILCDPRLIPCGHTYCLQCLKGLRISGLHPQQMLECPLCKKITRISKDGIEKFPPNFMAKQVQTALEEAQETLKHTYCDACRNRVSGLAFCRDCKSNLCSNCQTNHLAVFAGHVLVRDASNVATATCSVHPGQTISHFCRSCGESGCPLCMTSNHAGSGHTVITLEKAKDEFVSQTQDKLRELKDGKKKIEDRKEKLNIVGQKETCNFKQQIKEIEDGANEEIMKIRQKENDLKAQISDIHKSNTDNLDKLRKAVEADSASLDNTLLQTESALKDLRLSTFSERRWDILAYLADAVEISDQGVEEYIQDYKFVQGESLGHIVFVTDGHADPATDEPEDQHSDHPEIELDLQNLQVEMRSKRVMSPYPREALARCSSQQTNRKAFHIGSPMLVKSFVLHSGVDSIPIKTVGLGLLENGEVVCANNTNRMGQVVLCTGAEKQQVIYHRRKGIAAFSLFQNIECGVVLEDDCNISRLVLDEIPEDREVTCLTQKFSNRASNIGDLAFNKDGVVVITDTDKTCLIGIDRQNKRKFILNGIRNEDAGCFEGSSSLTIGMHGEIILYDGKKRRLAVFNENTKFRQYVDLPDFSSDCNITCDMDGRLYIADREQSKVFMMPIDGSDRAVELLNTNHGLTSPSCISVQGRALAVANARSFCESEIRVFEFGDNFSTHV